MSHLQAAAIPASSAKDTRQYDKVLSDISEYVHNYKISSEKAYETARLCLMDTLGCGLEALKFKECSRLLGPVVEGTTVPNGTRVPGTSYQLDPVRGAFNIGAAIRWLDYNDCWLAAEWGHPSDNLGAILSVADYLSRSGKRVKIRDVLEAMIKAHEIQGVLALENSFNRVGLDHVVLVKVASTAVVSKLLGLNSSQTTDAVSQAWVDGQSLRTYRHAPNTMSRKSWAAGDACSRAVNLALMVQRGEGGMPKAMTAKIWGFYDVLFKGREFQFQRPYGSYVMENILFKISFPAEFHAQTAVECAMKVHQEMKAKGKIVEDIKEVIIRTQEAAMRIIDKSGPLYNYADRDHCIQYMTAVPIIHGRLRAEDYSDEVANDPRIDELRAKSRCEERKSYTVNYHDPEKRSIGNAIEIIFNDGSKLEEIAVEYPVGHPRRRPEGVPLLQEKFQRHLQGRINDPKRVSKILSLQGTQLDDWEVQDYVDLYVQ